MDIPVSIILLTKNSSQTVHSCLDSIKEIATEIIVVDDGSTDQTLSIAKGFQAKIFTKKLESFGEQKQFALDQTSSEWVFLIDSDEQAPLELSREIKDILTENPSFSAYRIPRKNYYFGQWLRFGGKYPDYQVRLFKKKCCSFSKELVHEKINCNGKIGALKSAILHDSYPDMETWFNKLKLFVKFKSELLLKDGVKPSIFNLIRFSILRPLTRFLRRYIFKLGFLDGLPGLLACIHDALTEILSYFILHQKSKLGS